MTEVIKFDFNNNGNLTLDDISFGEPDIIDTPAPVTEVKPEVAAEVKSETEVEVKEKAVSVEAPTLDELEFTALDSTDEVAAEKETKTPAAEKPVVTSEIKLQAIASVLQAKLDRHNIEAGVDLTTLSEEELVDFEEALDNQIVDSKYNDFKSVDPNLKLISDYIENGGDPRKISKLFDEKESLTKIDIATEAGQIKMIKAYYEGVLGWSKDKVNSKIDRLSASANLEAEAEEVSQQYNEHVENKITQEADAQEKRQTAFVQREEKKKEIFESALKVSRIPAKTQADLKRVAFGEGVLPDGQTIKILDYQILKMQSDPDAFLKLAYFLANPEEYDKTILQYNKNTEVTTNLKKAFNFEPKPRAADTIKESKKENSKITFKF
jgi:predicted nucleic acid-binding protein